MFFDSMRKLVVGTEERIVFAEGEEERTLRAAQLLRSQNLAQPILLGNEPRIRAMAQTLQIDLANIPIVDPADDARRLAYSETYFELRKHKGIDQATAEQRTQKPHYFGALMVRSGDADGMVSGLNSQTKPFIPAFEIVKLKEGFKRASSVFVLEWPERLLFFADCSVNIDPDAQALAEIAHATAQTVSILGIKPRVAMLSFSTRSSAGGFHVDKVKEATRLAREMCPDVTIDGEVQFDAALLPEVASRKAPDSPFVQTGANVFIFPNLDAGNIAYKISERLGRAVATGPILQGLNHPINDVSRGCSFEGLANVGILTAALALMAKQ